MTNYFAGDQIRMLVSATGDDPWRVQRTMPIGACGSIVAVTPECCDDMGHLVDAMIVSVGLGSGEPIEVIYHREIDGPIEAFLEKL